MEIKRFDIEFIQRTQNLIKNYKGETEFTLLINCLLGLIILPSEFNNRKNLKYLNKELKGVKEINDILNKNKPYIFNPTHWDKKRKIFVNSKQTLGCFLKKIRNSIAHIASTKQINENGKWIGIEIIDINNKYENNVELKLILKYDQILVISEFISTEYQREILNIV